MNFDWFTSFSCSTSPTFQRLLFSHFYLLIGSNENSNSKTLQLVAIQQYKPFVPRRPKLEENRTCFDLLRQWDMYASNSFHAIFFTSDARRTVFVLTRDNRQTTCSCTVRISWSTTSRIRIHLTLTIILACANCLSQLVLGHVRTPAFGFRRRPTIREVITRFLDVQCPQPPNV